MSDVEKKFDSVLGSLSKHCDDDVPRLLEIFFDFLAKKTDFFAGQLPEQSRQAVVEALARQYEKLDEITSKKEQERQENERQLEARRKQQLELEKAKEAKLISAETVENVVLKTVGEYEKEKPKTKPPRPESDDEEIENERAKKDKSKKPKPDRPKPREETEEEKKKREEEEAIERARFMPNSGNGCDLPNYKWTQTLEQLEINVPLRAGFPLKGRDVVVEMNKTTLKVGVRGKDPIIDGELFKEVVINDDALWTLVDKSIVNIILPKKKKTEFWSKLMTTDPELSTKKMETGPMNFTDLEEDHKMVVEKLMYDSRAKEMGLPTSDEKKKMDIFNKIKKINPNINIDPSQIQMPGDRNGFSFN